MANDVTRQGAGFGSDRNAVTVLERDGRITEFPLKAKRDLADDILNVTRRWLVRPDTDRPAAALNAVKKP